MKKKVLLAGLMILSHFAIAQNNAVGIGTSTPEATLDVRRGVAPSGTAQFWGTGYITHINYGTDEHTYIRGGKAGSHVILNDVVGLGFVGLKTDNPYAPLTFDNNLGPKIALYGNTDNHYGFSITGGLLSMYSDAAAADIAFGFRSGGVFTENMRIKGDGNVGIRTNAPNASLDVGRGMAPWGTAVFRGTTYVSHFNHHINEDTYLRGGKAGSNLILNDEAGLGNVGIGNNNPGFKLDVSGRMRLRAIGASAGIWLNNNANDATPAFIGMEDDTYVGLYGQNGAGWDFTMNTQTGALKINGSEGTAGQAITSGGNGAPGWDFPVKAYQWAVPTQIDFNSLTEVTLVNQNITVSSNSVFIVSLQIGMLTNSCCSGSNAFGYIYIDGVKRATMNMTCPVNTQSSNTLPNFIQAVSAGTHSIEVKVKHAGGQAFSIYQTWDGGTLMSYVSVVVIAN